MGGHERGGRPPPPESPNAMFNRTAKVRDRESPWPGGHTSDSCILPPPISCSLLPLTRGGKDVQERICFASKDSHWCGRLCDHGLCSAAGSRGGSGEIPTLECIRSKLPATRDRKLQEGDPRHARAAGHRSAQLVPLRADPCT